MIAQKNINNIKFSLLRCISCAFMVFVLLNSCGNPEGNLKRYNRVKRDFKEITHEWISVAGNEFFELKLNGETAEFELFDKKGGKSWFSNPQMDDPLASGINKDYLRSQFRISYFNDRSLKKTMNSYADAVKNGQFEIRKTDKGAAVTYTLGEIDDIKLIPKVMSAKRFKYFYNKITEPKYKSQINRVYHIVDLKLLSTEKLKKENLKKYPQIKKGPIFKLTDRIYNKSILERIELGFIQAGYTLDDLKQDNLENNIAGEEPNTEIFTFTLYYDLAGDKFIVRIPTDEMYFHPSYPITYMRVLEFFGASRQGSSKEGYLFIPDGTGALIDFDNGKNSIASYYGNVYGDDPAIPPVVIQIMKQLPVLLPVFGMKQDENAFLAVIENGDAHASIYADVSGKINSYNYIGSEFQILPFSPVSLEGFQGNKFVNTYQKEPFQGEIKISYSFLSGDKADYCGMAARYSSDLFKKAPGKPGLTKNDPQVLLDFYMAINKVKHFIGIPYKGLEVLTTYNDVIDIMDDLDKRGIRNRILNIVGWEKGGVYHDAGLVPEPRVGSSNKRNELIHKSQQSGDTLFFDGSVTRILNDTLFDGYYGAFHTVQLLDRKEAKLHLVDIARGSPDRSLPLYYLVGPERGKKFYIRALDRVRDYNLPGFAFRFAGTYLHSDFYEHNQIARQQSLDYTVDLFKSLKDNNTNLLVRSGNAYSLPYADIISDIPLSSNDYLITDRSIPFLQMVLSGHSYYCSKAINLTDRERSTFLKLVETGTLPHFTVIKKDNSLLVDTFHNYLYSVNYEKLTDTIQDWVSELASIRSSVGNRHIVIHKFLSNDVVLVEYENGTKIIVNYGSRPYQYNNILIKGEDYTIVH